MLQGNILITGGAGYLGRAHYRTARRDAWDVRFTCLSRDDHKHKALVARYPEVKCIRGDVSQSIEFLTACFQGQDIIIHAAASKHVDLGEFNTIQTVQTNVIGTQNVLLAATAARVKQVIFISTDKACNPVNTYGATKYLGEKMVADFGREGWLNVVGVRYGNVIGSTGSVIKTFIDQYEKTGEVTITNPKMTRFWMPVEEAVELVNFAASSGQSGCIYIPYPAAMTIENVAKAAAPAATVRVIGQRPGEKVDEQLVSREESLRVQQGDNYMKLWPAGFTFQGETDFDVWSYSPPGGFMSIAEMEDAIADALLV